MTDRSRPGWKRPQSHFSQDPGGRRKAAPAVVPVDETEEYENVCYHGTHVSVDDQWDPGSTQVMPLIPLRDPRYDRKIDRAVEFQGKYPRLSVALGWFISIVVALIITLTIAGIGFLTYNLIKFASNL